MSPFVVTSHLLLRDQSNRPTDRVVITEPRRSASTELSCRPTEDHASVNLNARATAGSSLLAPIHCQLVSQSAAGQAVIGNRRSVCRRTQFGQILTRVRNDNVDRIRIKSNSSSSFWPHSFFPSSSVGHKSSNVDLK